MNNINLIKNKIAVLDFDETLIRGQSQKLLLDYFYKQKIIGLTRYLIVLLWFFLYKLNVLKEIKPIIEYAVSGIEGFDAIELKGLFDDFFLTVCRPRIYDNSMNLVSFLKAKGFHVLLISTAIEPIICRAKEYMMIDDIICTRLEANQDKYSGRIVGDPVYGIFKVVALKNYLNEKNYSIQNSIAFADHYSDVRLLETVAWPVAVNPSTKLLKYAQTKKWSVLYLNNNESFQHFKSNTKF